MSDNEPKFGKLREIPMKEIWEHEAHNFTPWLAKNIDALNDALGLNLRVEQREAPVGDFSLDILAKDEDTNRIIAIENQFGRTDHKHLGQLLTYVSGHDADGAIWIMETARDEHRAAVEWLNRKTDADTHFYLLTVKLIRIDDSLPVCEFIPVVVPNEQQKKQRQQSRAPRDITPQDKMLAEYFSKFAETMGERKFIGKWRERQSAFRAQRDYWCADNRGKYKWSYSHAMCGDNTARVFVQIHYARREGVDISDVRERVGARRGRIDEKLKLAWGERWKGERIIGVCRPGSFSDSEETLAEIRAWAVDSMLKLAEAIPPEMLREIADELEAEE